jgi:beta-glucanase (GH16 family)
MQMKNAVPGERRAAHLVTQLSALAAATSVLVAFIVIDAGASANSAIGVGTAQLGSGVNAKYHSSLNDQINSLAIGGTTSIGANVPKKYSAQLATKLTRIRRHSPTTTTTKAKSTTTTSSKKGSTSTTLANGTTITTFTNGTTTTTFANGTTTTTFANGSTTTTFANGTTTTTTAPKATTTTAPPTTTTAPPVTSTTTGSGSAIPDGVTNSSEPSGQAPPGANAMNGYKLTYSTDFSGSALPSGWNAYSGAPGASDPGSQWATSHAVVSGGMLSLNAWQDPAFGNEWVTGGTSQDGVSRSYGAYFVRSRETGGGPTLVELLWPTNNVWPPEIDFNETQGLSTFTTATNIWAVSNGTKSQAESRLNIDMTQWNTFGVIWTPTSITYTVNGRVWGTFTNASEIPSTPMHLDLQQQTWCGSSVGLDGEINACPTAPESMQIDWVAEYAAN